MNTIIVKKIELLDLLKKNKEKHKVEVDKAIIGYWKEVEEARSSLLRILDTGKVGKNPKNVNISISVPESHLDDYETAIQMLDMHQNETIEITKQEFENFAQDKWEWKRHWEMSNSKYWSNVDSK